MIIYKVTTRTGKSCLAKGKARVQYAIGKPARAPEWLAEKGYHPCAFRTLGSARNFHIEQTGYYNYNHRGWKIYKAEGKGIMQKKRERFKLIGIARGIFMENFWFKCFPTNTVMCREITLLEEVK